MNLNLRTAVSLLFLGAVCYLTKEHSCINLIDLPLTIQQKWQGLKPNHFFKKPVKMPLPASKIKDQNKHLDYYETENSRGRYPPVRSTTQKFDIRRYFLVNENGNLKGSNPRAGEYEDEKDANLKTKISTLVQQTVHDTERKIKSIQEVKENNRETGPYKAGFILSMIKKSRDVLNELFNVAVKHKDEWKALEQMKIFEMIVHTNVDTTNLVRHLVEIHIQQLNSSNPDNPEHGKRRVVLLR